MSRYALIEDSAIIRIDSKPHLPDDGFPSWRPIVDNPTAYDPATQNRAQNPQAEWTIGESDVTVTYTVTDKTAQEFAAYIITKGQEAIMAVKEELRQALIDAEYAATLATIAELDDEAALDVGGF